MRPIFTIHAGEFIVGEHSERKFKGLNWPAPGSEDTELGVFMGPEVDHGETKVHTRVQA
jgi:hypothetical protein